MFCCSTFNDIKTDHCTWLEIFNQPRQKSVPQGGVESRMSLSGLSH